MRLNRTFLRNFAGDHSRTIALCSFFVHRYHIGDDSLSMLSSFMNYIAVKMKGVAVCYDSLDKYYEEWKLYGAEKKIDVSNEERSNIEERLSVFIGLKDCESLSSENKKILESFLVPNDSAMFYVYVASIDLFYMFIQCWRNHEVRQCAELGHIYKLS